MVLEALLKPKIAEEHPFKVFVYGVLIALIAVLLTLTVFKGFNEGLMLVFFTALASIPLIYSIIRWEEDKTRVMIYETNIFKEHEKAIKFFIFLFLGFVFTYTCFAVLLPETLSTNMFYHQIKEITNINNLIQGKFLGVTFNRILLNNLKVLILATIFSFIYGFGAIFIISWNASVISVAIASLIKNKLLVLNGFTAVVSSLLRYLIHGIPEMTAYFLGALAGGIISSAIISKHIKGKYFQKYLFDAGLLLSIAVLILIIATWIEISISPLLQ